MKILDIGCRENKYPNAIGLDRYKFKGVDIVWDLEKLPLPFKTDEFDVVVARHTLEHIKNLIPLLGEIWRITKKDSIVKVWVPYWKGSTGFSSLEHCHYFNTASFDIFDIGSHEFKAKFRVMDKKINLVMSGKMSFLNVLNPLLNLNFTLYERFLSIFFPADEIYFELEVLK